MLAMHPYEEIRTEILRRINSQTWPAGFSVPHEAKLAEEFGVARGTIRRAMETLVDAGLIERRRRAGTRVVGRKSHSSTLTIPVVRHDIESGGHAYGYKLLMSSVGDQAKDDQGLFAGTSIRRIVSLHLSDGRPYQLEDRLVNLTAIPEANDADFSAVSPNEWLIARVPYSSVRTTLRAELPSADDAKYLKLQRGEPVFVIERQTQLDGEVLTLVRMAHPAGSFQMITATDGFQ